MIVKRLRDKNGWSQEQLAEFCGLNVRTIQRVESGQKASLETLKALASVFEVDISTLTEEITMIDKTTEKWQQQPWWFKVQMLGIRRRKTVIGLELAMLATGAIGWAVTQDSYIAAVFFLGAYLTALMVRFGDKRQVW